MDPLTITASAVSLAANILRSAAYIKNAADEYRNAPSVVCDIEREVNIVHAALRQVEAALQRDAQAIFRLCLQDVFELSVEGCRDTLRHIDENFKALFGRRDWKVRVSVWWNAGEIRRLLMTLDAKKGSLMLLVQALSLHSVQELQDLLHQNMSTPDIPRSRLNDMVHSYSAYTSRELDSGASAIGSNDSVLGSRDSDDSSTRFVFDEVCFTSKPYRHTMERVSVKKASSVTKKGKAVGQLSNLPGLQPVSEIEVDTDGGSPAAAAQPASPTGVTTDEHEAVVMKLREAETLIRLLQERMQHSAMPKEPEFSGSRPTRMAVQRLDPFAGAESGKTPQSAASTGGNTSGRAGTYYTVFGNEVSVPIATRHKAAHRTNGPRRAGSQTSLLIDDAEGVKRSDTPETTMPPVRVRFTPDSASRQKDRYINPVDAPQRWHKQDPKGGRLTRSTSVPDYHGPVRGCAANKAMDKALPDPFLGKSDLEDRRVRDDIPSIPRCSFFDAPDPRSLAQRFRPPAEGTRSILTTAKAAADKNERPIRYEDSRWRWREKLEEKPRRDRFSSRETLGRPRERSSWERLGRSRERSSRERLGRSRERSSRERSSRERSSRERSSRERPGRFRERESAHTAAASPDTGDCTEKTLLAEISKLEQACFDVKSEELIGRLEREKARLRKAGETNGLNNEGPQTAPPPLRPPVSFARSLRTSARDVTMPDIQENGKTRMAELSSASGSNPNPFSIHIKKLLAEIENSTDLSHRKTFDQLPRRYVQPVETGEETIKAPPAFRRRLRGGTITKRSDLGISEQKKLDQLLDELGVAKTQALQGRGRDVVGPPQPTSTPEITARQD